MCTKVHVQFKIKLTIKCQNIHVVRFFLIYYQYVLFTRVAILITEKNAFLIEEFLRRFFLWSLGPNAVRIHCISYACRFFRGHLYFARSLTQLCVLFTRVAILITEKNAFVIEEFLGDFFWWSLGPNRVRSQCIRSICSFVPMSNQIAPSTIIQ